MPGTVLVEGVKPLPSWNSPSGMVSNKADEQDSERDEIGTVKIPD